MFGLIDRDLIKKVEKPNNGETGFLALGFDAGLGEDKIKTPAELGRVVVEKKKWLIADKPNFVENYNDVLKPLPIEVSPFSLWLTMGKKLKDA